MNRITAIPALISLAAAAPCALAQSFDLSWHTIDCGGGTSLGGAFELSGTIGQHDAGPRLTGGAFDLGGGFWHGIGPAASCYANCDNSTTIPILNINDFVCFQQRFAAGSSYANCDNSTTPPVLNVNDFVCFQQQFAAGCP